VNIRNVLIIQGLMAQLLGVILCIALLSARPRTIANRLLAVALACVISRQFLLVMKISGTIASFPLLFRLSFPLQLLAIPAFYLYAVALTTPDFKLERKHAVHLIPFGIGALWYCGVLIWGGPSLFEFGPVYDREVYLRLIVKVAVVIPYLILAWKQVLAFAHDVRERVSDISPFRLNWLRTLLILASVSAAIDVLDLATGPSIPVWQLAPGVWLISTIVMAYLALRVSPVFARESEFHKSERLEITAPVAAAELATPVAAAEFDAAQVDPTEEAHKGRLSEEELKRQKQRLTGILEAQSLYLNPELRLSDLAAALGVRPYRVSEILNQGLHTSFYDLINQYRITKAQELLSSRSAERLNLLGIAMESGFRSKSVFNDVFKKATGQTPSQFRSQKMTEPSDPAGRIARPGR
jgi:AraC-like DNA-binding protein